jgi:hypothetical protein
VRIPKGEVSRALGNFITSARSEGDDYIITVEKTVGEGGRAADLIENSVDDEIGEAETGVEKSLEGDGGE